MTLIDKIAKKIGTLVLIGLPFYDVGCVATTEYPFGRTYPDDNPSTPKQDSNPQPPRPSQPTDEFIVEDPVYGRVFFVQCNYVKDFGNDGIDNYPEDFIGIKRSFSKDEKVTIRFGGNQRMFNIAYRLHDKNGKMIRLDNNCSPNGTSGLNEIYGPNELEDGKYIATIHDNNRLVKKIEFEILENKLASKN